MRIGKIYIQIFFLFITLFLEGCRLLTGDNTDPESVVQVDYGNDLLTHHQKMLHSGNWEKQWK